MSGSPSHSPRLIAPRLHRGVDALPPELRSLIGRRVRELRIQSEMSMEEVAALVPISSGTLGALERGEIKNPPLGTLLKLVAVMKVGTIELFLGSEDLPSAKVGQQLIDNR